MYMSYCRFEGTRYELNACIGDVEEHINEEAEYPVSESEIEHFKKMLHDFYEFIYETEILTDDGELDEEMIEAICQKMREGCNSYD